MLDLLCLDASGRIVVVELKRENAYRVALAQVLDYAACIAALSYEDLKTRVDENRKKRNMPGSLDDLLDKLLGEQAEDWAPENAEPRVMLVGTGADASLRRIVDYLTARYEIPINGIFFDVSKTTSGSKLLVRSAVVADEQAIQQGRRRGRGGMTHDELLAFARGCGTTDFIEEVLSAWRSATGRDGRPERKERCWSLGSKGDGRTVAAWLYPCDDVDPSSKKAWLTLSTKKLAADLNLDEPKLLASITTAGLALEERSVALSDKPTAERVAAWIATLYAQPVSP